MLDESTSNALSWNVSTGRAVLRSAALRNASIPSSSARRSASWSAGTARFFITAISSPSTLTGAADRPSTPGPGVLYGLCCIVGDRSTNAGITGSVWPWSRATTLPKCGRISRRAASIVVAV